ncbi:hypothetical protein LCGC14_2951060, partial [marine sediment metagenome]
VVGTRLLLDPAIVGRIDRDETVTGLWSFVNALGLLTDIIGERTGGAGVTVDGVILRDRAVVVPDFASAGLLAIQSAVLADAEFRYRRDAAGLMVWGDGALAPDTNLYRDAPNRLKTDDRLDVGLDLIVNQSITAIADVTVGSDLTVNERTLLKSDNTGAMGAIENALGGGGRSVLRMTPNAGGTRVNGMAGQSANRVLLLINLGSDAVTIGHQDANGSAVQRFICPNAADLVLGNGENVWVWYDGTTSRWRVIGIV